MSEDDPERGPRRLPLLISSSTNEPSFVVVGRSVVSDGGSTKPGKRGRVNETGQFPKLLGESRH